MPRYLTYGLICEQEQKEKKKKMTCYTRCVKHEHNSCIHISVNSIGSSINLVKSFSVVGPFGLGR